MALDSTRGSTDSAAGRTSESGRGVKLYECSYHQVTSTRFRTSTDPRGYIPVFEYTIKSGQTMMIDSETGYVHFTGIWKAVSDTKPDVARLLEASPDLTERIRKVRGGHLKIQGTWLPFDIAESLSRRVAFAIRDELIPFFGPSFPSSCLTPKDEGYGELYISSPNKASTSKPFDPTSPHPPQIARSPQRIKTLPTPPPKPSTRKVVPTPSKAVSPTRHTHRRRSYSSVPELSPTRFYDVAFVTPRRASVGPVYVPRDSWGGRRYSPYGREGSSTAYEASSFTFPQSVTRSTYDVEGDEEGIESEDSSKHGIEETDNAATYPSTPPILPRQYHRSAPLTYDLSPIDSPRFSPPHPRYIDLQCPSPAPKSPINYCRSSIPLHHLSPSLYEAYSASDTTSPRPPHSPLVAYSPSSSFQPTHSRVLSPAIPPYHSFDHRAIPAGLLKGQSTTTTQGQWGMQPCAPLFRGAIGMLQDGSDW